ncbi:MAG: type II toxin-antitoxin system YoeB family toxin [Nitrospirae bacterium]|nr:type II toxin-antitoxin system YoeB family toxin [Nitrospirota bacterium]MBF0519444.1 type II toxin-antitoxin system YoeB family toxin [Nitrospirota bacterium]MBF0534800.1 type II toxin-antitoxin system YoeB family toxin [Nitrospirota bacterium]MBF0616474.1 type II toxin-antitoxin system YoeB family toxin [Nitrospirota bacterium]
MRSLVFDPHALEDLEWWVKEDKKKVLKIINLIKYFLSR